MSTLFDVPRGVYNTLGGLLVWGPRGLDESQINYHGLEYTVREFCYDRRQKIYGLVGFREDRLMSASSLLLWNAELDSIDDHHPDFQVCSFPIPTYRVDSSRNGRFVRQGLTTLIALQHPTIILLQQVNSRMRMRYWHLMEVLRITAEIASKTEEPEESWQPGYLPVSIAGVVEQV